MHTQDNLYITGHIHPDTDSIASAIGYAFLKRALGYPAVACRLGPVNSETRYLLERFHFDEPVLLEDARIQLHEMTLDHPVNIHLDTTVFEVLQLMQTVFTDYFYPFVTVFAKVPFKLCNFAGKHLFTVIFIP